MYERCGAFTQIVAVTSAGDLVDDTDGTAVSTLPGIAYGRAKRWGVAVTADAAGEFNVLAYGYVNGAWSPLGQGGGDVNGGASFAPGAAGQCGFVEGFSLGLAERLAFLVVIASGTPTVTVEVAPVMENL